jgi:valyl-tRNA synthetase
MVAPYPKPASIPDGEDAALVMRRLFDLVRTVRNARQAAGLGAGVRGRVAPVRSNGSAGHAVLRYLPSLAGVELVTSLERGEPLTVQGAPWRVEFGESGERRVRLERERTQAEGDLARVRAKLADPNFVARAPEAVVARERQREEEARQRLERLVRALEEL